MGFGRFGPSLGGSIEIPGLSDLPKIITTPPERKMRNPLGEGSMPGVKVELVQEAAED